MPKMKSKDSVKKRFRSNASGSTIKRSSQNAAKHLTRKSAKRKMRLRKGGVVSKTDKPAIARALGE